MEVELSKTISNLKAKSIKIMWVPNNNIYKHVLMHFNITCQRVTPTAMQEIIVDKYCLKCEH